MEFVKLFKGDIVATRDTHYHIEQYETNHLPLHCLEGTHGNELYEDLNKYLTCTQVKSSFGSLILLENIYRKIPHIDNIYICGLCTDICVINNALILRNQYNKDIIVLSDLCAGTTKENHQKALDLMKINLIEVRESKEVING